MDFFNSDYNLPVGKKCRLPPLSASRVPLKIYVSWNSIKGRNSYLRTHLTNGCTEYMEIKHRCSQITVQSYGAWCGDAECSSWGRSLQCHCCCCPGCSLPLYFCLLQNQCWHCFCFLPFFSISAKILFGFLSVSQNRHHYRSFIRVKWCKRNFQKAGIPVPALEGWDNKQWRFQTLWLKIGLIMAQYGGYSQIDFHERIHFSSVA